MELSNEEIVTRLLSAKEILQVRSDFRYVSPHGSEYNLGNYINTSGNSKELHAGKYSFIQG